MTYSARDLEKRYAEFLDDCYGTVKIAGYEYETSIALAEIDPVAFRCGFADWLASEIGETLWELPNGEYTDEEPEGDEE
jgi:hypothetical protein